MDYEKRYKEALEKANAAHKDEDRHLKATLERIFPELNENEDERIRKMLIEFFSKGAEYNSSTNGISDKDIISWLEKQGEQKPVSITDEWIEDYWQHEKVNNPYSHDKGEEIQFDHQGFVRFCKKYCKKPTAWSEEDKDFMYDTLSNLTELKDIYGEGLGNIGKCIEWLKSLKERVGCEANCTTMWKPSESRFGEAKEAEEADKSKT